MLNRRELIRVLTAGFLSQSYFAAQIEEPQFAGLDRVEFYVSNVEKSRDFFVGVFGNTLKNRNGKRYVKIGSSYMAFEPPRGNAGQVRIDHFSISIKHLEMPKLHGFLDQRGIAYQDYPSGRDTSVTDSDGIRTQLSPEDGWSFLNTANFPAEAVAAQNEPVFSPVGLDHVQLNVTDPERSVSFYRKLLGEPAERNSNRIWFQTGKARVGLQRTPDGERAGVHLFCISVARFEYNTSVRRLQQLGAAIEPSEFAGSVQFRDPDGFRIRITQEN